MDSGAILLPTGNIGYGASDAIFQVKAPLKHVISKFEIYCPEPDWKISSKKNESWSAECAVPMKDPHLGDWTRKIGALKDVKLLPGKYSSSQLDEMIPGTKEDWTTIYIYTNEPYLWDNYIKDD